MMKQRSVFESSDSDESDPFQASHPLWFSAVDDVAAIQTQLHELKLVVTTQSIRIQYLEDCLSKTVTGNGSEPSSDTISVGPDIHILPVELLIKIFNAVVYGNAANAKSRCQYTIILSHVCRDWRAITLDIPRLWCNIPTSLKVSGLKAILGRSKSFPLNIFCDTSSDSPRLRILTTYITQSDTMQRCENISWTSSESALSGIMYTLNSTKGYSFTNLSTLDLSAKLRGLAFLGPLFEYEARLPKFPKLTHVRLACISPEELPPSIFPALQTIYIYFPQERIQLEGISRSPSLRMSNILSLLSRAPQLEQLTLDEAIPILDVKLVSSNIPDNTLSLTSRRTTPYVQPIKMSDLTAFSWYHCPPKDLWRFFHFLSLTHLQTLHLLLDPFTSRWQGERDGEIFDMETTMPLSDYPVSTLVVRLPNLENLVLEFSDIEGLTTCFRKFLVPSLKTLSLAYTPPKYLEEYHLVPDLPTPESIFRNPPMPTLVALTISNLNLDLKNILLLLGYTPSLRSLSLEGCIGATNLVVSLSARGLNSSQSWICPRLDSLTFIKCDDLEPNHLNQLISYRNTASEMRTDTQPARRPLKPLKRRALMPLTDSSNVFTDGRDFRPSRIKSLRVEGCKRIHDWDLDSKALSSYFLY